MDSHSVSVTWSGDLQRSRLTTFFRYIMAIPHFVWLYIYGIGAGVVMMLAWLVTIFTGRVPKGFHSFLVGYQVYSSRVTAYVLLLGNEFPPFSSEDPYPVTVQLPAVPPKQSRLS